MLQHLQNQMIITVPMIPQSLTTWPLTPARHFSQTSNWRHLHPMSCLSQSAEWFKGLVICEWFCEALLKLSVCVSAKTFIICGATLVLTLYLVF